MHEEEPFALALLAGPGDDAPRLIYADWLEERGDLDRANFLRLGTSARRRPLADDPPEIDEEPALADESDAPDPAELHRIMARIDPDWLALISRAPRAGIIWSPEDLSEFLSNASPGGRLEHIRAWRPARGPDDGSSTIGLGDQVYVIVRDEGAWQLVGRMLFHRRDYPAPTAPAPRETGRGRLLVELRGIQGSTIRADRPLPEKMGEWFSFRTRGGARWWTATGRGASYLRRYAVVELAPSTAAILDRLLLGWISPGGD